MNDLTPVFERETGQLILEGPPAGVAGEAPLIPVHGLELAFDRADGWLCRAVAEAAEEDGSLAVGEQAAAMLIRLFGPEAPEPGARRRTTRRAAHPGPLLRSRADRHVVQPGPPRRGPGHQPGTAGLAVVGRRGRRAGRTGRPARAGPRRGPASGDKLLGQLDSLKTLPAEAVRTAVGPPASTPSPTRKRPPGCAEALKKLTGRTPDSPAAGRRVRRSGRGRAAGKGPRAPGRPALDARSRPRARRALPARVVAPLGPLRTA